MSESEKGKLSQGELEALKRLTVEKGLEEPAFRRKGVMRRRREDGEDPAKAGGFYVPFDFTREPTVELKRSDIMAVRVLDRRVDLDDLKSTRKRKKDGWPNF